MAPSAEVGMLHENRFLAGNLLIPVRVEPSDAEYYLQWCLAAGPEITITPTTDESSDRRAESLPAPGDRPWDPFWHSSPRRHTGP